MRREEDEGGTPAEEGEAAGVATEVGVSARRSGWKHGRFEIDPPLGVERDR